MARKSKSSKRGAARGRHLRAVPAMSRPPQELLVAGQVLDSFTPDFVRWFEQSYGEPEWAMEFLDSVGLLMAASLELTGRCSATDFPPATVEVLLEDMAQWGEDDVVQGLVECLHVYLDFLNETGRWSGSAPEFEEAHELLVARLGGGAPFEVPDLGEDEEATAFAELELIRRTTALLSWLGTGKAVTSTGALRLKDVGPAAELVGVEVRAQWNAQRPLQPLPGFEGLVDDEALEGDGIPVVRSMHEVPVLQTVWPALRKAGIVEIGATTARPSEAAQDWLHGSAARRIEAYRQFTTWFLRVAVSASSTDVLWQVLDDQFKTLLTGALLAGCTPSPLPRQRLEVATTDEDEPADLLTGIALRRLRGALDELTELGLLEQGEHYRVPPVVVRCVAAAFDAEPPTAAEVEEAAYQLKIALRGARPPIWRRVRVPSTMRLSELHQLIQLVFGWEDYHLHFFSTGNGHDGTRYGSVQPPGPLGAFAEDDSIDESTVPVGALLQHVGDELTYLYDFGDDWYHDITLEKVDGPDPAQELPRCTGGRGAAPAEDSGGVWGWAGVVAAVNDPAHPEHDELREWLGLRPGETVDPKAFDVASADAALGALR